MCPCPQDGQNWNPQWVKPGGLMSAPWVQGFLVIRDVHSQNSPPHRAMGPLPKVRGTQLRHCLREASVQFSSVAQSCLTLCDTMNRSTPGFPVHHQLPEPTQTLVHRVGDAIQPSHPLSSPSPPALNLSQHQGLFQ